MLPIPGFDEDEMELLARF